MCLYILFHSFHPPFPIPTLSSTFFLAQTNIYNRIDKIILSGKQTDALEHGQTNIQFLDKEELSIWQRRENSMNNLKLRICNL